MRAHLVKDLHPYKTIANVSEKATIRDMAKLIVEHPGLHFLSVIDEGGYLLGLISRKRLFQSIFSHHVSASSMVTTLYSLLTSEYATDLLLKHVITCREMDSLDKAINTMIENRLDGIPVLDGSGKYKGLLTIEQLLQNWLESDN